MRGLFVIAAVLLVLSSLSFADFNLAPYIYPSEDTAEITYATFSPGNNSTTVKIVKIGGIESVILQDERLVTDSAQIQTILAAYYQANYYPSQDDLTALKDNVDAYNRSRNYQSRYGPAEKVCRTGGTFLDYMPCNDMTSCMKTASLVCTISGAEGCIMDLLAQYILDYEKSIEKLDAGYEQFITAYNSLSPATMSNSFTLMDSALDTLKAGGEAQSKTKLRFPEKTLCSDCLGVCPEPHLDYESLKAGKDLIASLKDKTSAYSKFDAVVANVQASTADRIAFRQGEEKAVIFAPKVKIAEAKYGGLKAQAIEAKALVADASFVTSADNFLNAADTLGQKFDRRDFEGFDSALSAYETSGRTLSVMINNSTAAYRVAMDAQDSANDKVLEAQWSVNRLSKASVDSYNSLADRKNKLDDKFKPPQTSAQYYALADSYGKITSDSKTYLAASSSVQTSIFSAGNSLGRTSVDGAMALFSSVTPVSFKTRKSVATFAPPVVLAVIDLSILAAALLVFVGLFYYFRGFFRSRLAASGWALTFLFFAFILVVGSGAFYAIVMSTEQYTTFADFFDSYKAAPTVAVIVQESGAPQDALNAMRACATQIEAQAKLAGKKTLKYYISGTKCTSVIPKASSNSSNSTYVTDSNMLAASCLDNMADVPIFDMYYSAENKPPVFTTVVTKSATFKYNEAAWGRKPLCPVADVLG